MALSTRLFVLVGGPAPPPGPSPPTTTGRGTVRTDAGTGSTVSSPWRSHAHTKKSTGYSRYPTRVAGASRMATVITHPTRRASAAGVDGSTSLTLQNVALATPRESLTLFSNDPESVYAPQLLYAASLPAGRSARLVYHHQCQAEGVDLTSEEYDAYLQREVSGAVGMTVADFVRAYTAGELDDTDPAVSDLVGLLRVGQNGHRAAA